MTLVPLLLAASLAAGNAEFDRVAADGAAEIALGRVRRELAANGPVTGLLARAMLASPKDFRAPAEAETVCRLIYASAVDRAYAEAAARIRRDLRLPAASDELGTNEHARAMTLFAKRFAAERAAACAAQAETIARTIRPKESEFETKDTDALKAELCDRVASAQRQPVFDENLAYISEKIVDPLVADAQREMKRQREYLSRTRCEAYAPSALAKELEANLRKNVAERRAKSKDPTREWDVFPATFRAALPQAVATNTFNRVVQFANGVTLDLDVESLRKRMEAQPTLHFRATESEKHFRTTFAAEVLEVACARAVQKAPAAEREEFAAYLKEKSDDPALAKSIDDRVRLVVPPALKAARKVISADDFKTHWPSLEDGSWYPDAALADAVLARSDATQAIGEWRRLDAMAALAKNAQTQLEETGRLADKSVAAAFDRARNARNEQNKLVGQACPVVLAEARERKNSFFRRTPDLNAVKELLTAEVTSKWGESRTRILWPYGEVPANASEQYAELFPSVKRRIELEALQILKDMEKSEAKQKPEESSETKMEMTLDDKKTGKKSGTVPGDTPSSEDQNVKDDDLISITVRRSGGKVNVTLKQGERTLEDCAAENMTEFKDAMKRVSNILGRDLLKLR